MLSRTEIDMSGAGSVPAATLLEEGPGPMDIPVDCYSLRTPFGQLDVDLPTTVREEFRPPSDAVCVHVTEQRVFGIPMRSYALTYTGGRVFGCIRGFMLPKDSAVRSAYG